ESARLEPTAGAGQPQQRRISPAAGSSTGACIARVTDHWSAYDLSPKGERWLRGLVLAEFQRKFHPTRARGPISRVDQLEYRPAVRTGLLRHRRVEDAADEVIHLLRNAGVPQLVEDG